MASHDVPQDRVDVTPRRDQGTHPKVVVHENVVRRSVNLETGEEEIEVLDAGELAAERFSRSPARNRTVPAGNVTITKDARGRVPRSAGRFFTRFFGGDGRPRAIPAIAASWPHRAAFLGPPLCIPQVDLVKMP